MRNRSLIRFILAGAAAFVSHAALADAPPSFAACGACHSERAGALGPSLHGLVGRKAGTAAGFRYSPAMKGSPIVWDKAKLDAYLTNPQKSIPGNTMAFPGVADAKDRAAIVAHLETLK
jgi:cytochrome c